MQKLFLKEACISFSSQSNYINNKKKLPGTISALHCSVEPEFLYKIKKNDLHDTISGHFAVVNLAAESIKSCLVKLQLHVAILTNLDHVSVIFNELY